MQVVNLKSIRDRKNLVVCDRSSVLGNPFWMAEEALRRSATLGFRRYVWLVLQEEEPIAAAQTVAQQMRLTIASTWIQPIREQFMTALNSLKADNRLGCHCAPKDCHAEQIVRSWAYLHPQAAAIAAIQACAYCHRLATRLCDGRLDTGGKSCDRPLCLDCTHSSGRFIACSRNYKQSFSDSIDLCRECRQRKQGSSESGSS